MMENEAAGRVVCSVSVGVWKLQRWRELRARVYVCICACMHSHLCLLRSEKREMVRFIYTRHGACSPSEKIGCERCQLYALSAVSASQ